MEELQIVWQKSFQRIVISSSGELFYQSNHKLQGWIKWTGPEWATVDIVAEYQKNYKCSKEVAKAVINGYLIHYFTYHNSLTSK